MIRFTYQAYDSRGALVSGAIDSTSRESALQTLSMRGVHAARIEASSEAGRVPWWQKEIFAPAPLRDGERLAFTRELSALIAAELPVDEALEILSLQPGLPSRVKVVSEGVLRGVREGRSLGGALSASGAFPLFYTRLVSAGETSGSLKEALGDLARTLERNGELRTKVTSALAYPAVLCAVAAGALAVVTFVLIPAVMPLFADAGVAPPLLLSGLDALSRAAGSYGFEAGAVAVLCAVLVSLLWRQGSVRLWRDRIALRLPVAGRLIRTGESGKLARLLAMQLKNGVPLVDALAALEPVMGNAQVGAAVKETAGRVREGATLSRELAKSGVFEDILVRLAGIGERTGQLEAMLVRAAAINETALQRALERLTQMLGPLLTLVIGVLAGGIILSVMQAILSINDLAVGR